MHDQGKTEHFLMLHMHMYKIEHMHAHTQNTYTACELTTKGKSLAESAEKHIFYFLTY